MGMNAIYPSYPKDERMADFVMHALGVVLSITGAVLLITFAALYAPVGQVAAVSVYGGILILAFLVSLLFHFPPWETARPIFRRIDQATIYLKIAGTYTPFVVLIGSMFSYVVLGLVWTLALAGILAKLFFWKLPGKAAAFFYLGLGWFSLVLIWPVAVTLPLATTILIVTGGVIYSVGVTLFYWLPMRFETATWHAMVLAASGCFFAAIAAGMFA